MNRLGTGVSLLEHTEHHCPTPSRTPPHPPRHHLGTLPKCANAEQNWWGVTVVQAVIQNQKLGRRSLGFTGRQKQHCLPYTPSCATADAPHRPEATRNGRVWRNARLEIQLWSSTKMGSPKHVRGDLPQFIMTS